MAINILDSMIINRISAGEVVESPFSIVKELIDNSLDAGADKIYVEIKNGGIDSIIIKDNGKGIEYDDIIKAFLPHATSKISNIDDLNAISTLGFRGEALASISNVTQTKIVTKTQNQDIAYQMEVNGGNFGEIQPTESSVGTKIQVNNLFFNTPARRKFLHKPKQEESKITNIISRYILANPQISFTYLADGKTIFQTNGSSLLDAIYCVYGDDIVQNIIPVNKEIGNLKLSGYVSKVGYSKPNTTYQTLIVNKRYVVDEIVSKASYMAFEEYLMTRQFPFYVLNLTMPAVDVDVNVHPSKINIKFANPSQIYDLVYSAIRGAIYDSLNNNHIEQSTAQVSEQHPLIKVDLDSLKEIEIDPVHKPVLNDTATLKQSNFSPISLFDLPAETPSNTIIVPQTNIQNKALNKMEKSFNFLPDGNDESFFKDISQVVDFKVLGQLFNEFLVIERGDNMILLDFHAGHERLNYDKFTKMVENRQLIIQDLLVPYRQKLTPIEVEYLLTLQTKLNELGFDLQTVNDDTIEIKSIPMQLKDINLKNFVDDLLHDMKNIKPAMNNEIRHYLMQKACKSSVKSGMTLSELEINALLKDLDEKNPVLLCPHGRPILTVVTRAEIEKWFKRIV